MLPQVLPAAAEGKNEELNFKIKEIFNIFLEWKEFLGEWR